jgi:hypothetical protein
MLPRKDETPARIRPDHERSRGGWIALLVIAGVAVASKLFTRRGTRGGSENTTVDAGSSDSAGSTDDGGMREHVECAASGDADNDDAGAHCGVADPSERQRADGDHDHDDVLADRSGDGPFIPAPR